MADTNQQQNASAEQAPPQEATAADQQQPQPAPKKDDASPQKRQSGPKKAAEPSPAKSPKSRSHSQSYHSADESSKSRSLTHDPFIGMPAAERVKLGYEMAKQKFSQRRVSASFASRTGRDPYSVLAPGGSKPPHIEKREEQEAARLEALRQEIRYDPALRPPASDFDGNRSTDSKRASSWTRDASKRRPFAPRYDIIPSSRGNDTPGPGAYTSPLAFIGAA